MLRLLGVTVLWGFNYVASAYLLREFSPIFLSYSRLLLTSAFLIAIALIGERPKRPSRSGWGLLIMAGIFGTLFNQFFYFTGLQGSTAGNASLIIALSPVATVILARVFLGEAIGAFKLIGTLMALAGVVVIVGGGGASFGISSGDVYLLLAMLALSISLLFVRRLSKVMSSYDITILGTVIGTTFMTPAAVWEGVQGNIHYSGDAVMWIVLAAAAIIGSGLSGFWWNEAISVVGASTASVFMNVPPFVAIIASYFLLGDPITGAQIAGGALILLGVGLSNRMARSRRREVRETA